VALNVGIEPSVHRVEPLVDPRSLRINPIALGVNAHDEVVDPRTEPGSLLLDLGTEAVDAAIDTVDAAVDTVEAAVDTVDPRSNPEEVSEKRCGEEPDRGPCDFSHNEINFSTGFRAQVAGESRFAVNEVLMKVGGFRTSESDARTPAL
jgi:hypothetical protein